MRKITSFSDFCRRARRKTGNCLHRLYKPFADIRTELKTKHITIETAELVSQQGKDYGHVGGTSSDRWITNRLDVAVRFLAVDCYLGKNDYGLNLYRKMQSERIRKGYEDEAEQRFKELIDNFRNNGYEQDSEIELDSDLMLIDGSHRIALALYFGVKELSCKIRPYKTDIKYDVTWFIEHGFTLSEISIVKEKAKELFASQTGTLSCVLWPPVYPYFDEITEKLRSMYDVVNIRDCEYKGETFERIVRAIYSVDDIEKWKIDKKLEGMSAYPHIIRLMEIRCATPRFRLKASNNHTLSAEGERIKAMICNAYKGRVDNYFYDIIMHTGDNYRQSSAIVNMMTPRFSLRDYFEMIRKYDYIVIKNESDYLPDDFPDSYPFGKDLDIICKKECADDLVNDTLNFAHRYCDTYFSVRSIENGSNTRIRIEQGNHLIFQFDVSAEPEGLSPTFIRDAVAEREEKDCFFVPRMEDELIFRAWEGAKYGTESKMKHIRYIIAHKEKWNSRKARESLPSMWDMVQKQICEQETNDSSL